MIKDSEKKDIFYVIGMSCAGCALSVESTLVAREGVKEAKVNFASSTVMVVYDENKVIPADLQKAVQSAGYDLIIEEEEENQAEKLQQEEYLKLKRKTVGAILLALPVFIIGMFFMHMPYGDWIMLVFTVPVLTVFGRDFFKNAWRQLKHGRANMDTLVAVSTGIAFLFSLFSYGSPFRRMAARLASIFSASVGRIKGWRLMYIMKRWLLSLH